MALHIHVYRHLEVTSSSVILKLKHLNIKCGVFLMGFFYKCNHTGMKVASIAGKLYNHVSARYVFSFSVLVATL